MVTTQQTNTKSATPDMPHEVKIERFSRNLRCELTQDELNERAREAARLVNEIDQKDEDQKAAAKQAKAQIAELVAEHRRISEEVRVGATYKQVQCERHYVFRTGVVQEIRIDNKRVIAERAMTDRERQLDLFDGGKPPNGEAQEDEDLEASNGHAVVEEDEYGDAPSASAANDADEDDDGYGEVEEAPPALLTAKPKRGRGRTKKGPKPS